MSRRGRPPKRNAFDQNGFEAWGGYMAAKKAKLENQFKETAGQEKKEADDQRPKGIFEGVAIHVNGFTDPSSDELKRIMMVNGGVYHHYPSSKTTHYIASNLPDVKMKALKGHEIIVHPKWITESLASGRLLDYKKYLVYTKKTSSQPKIAFGAPVPQPKPDEVAKSSNSEEITKGQALDAKSDKFLSEFYNNSRLHLISTMAADFKKYVTDLRAEKSKPWKFPDRSKLEGVERSDENCGRLIAHVDMDCFFVSVSLLKHPELRGFPVAVTHAKGSDSSYSEIASCSYEAREKGVRNGMFLGPALKVCPELRTIPYDFEGYRKVARTLYDTVARYTLQIQAASCDEMLVDLTEVLGETGASPLQFAELLRSDIHSATRCRASVGMGPNSLLAKLATKKAKPDGAFCLKQLEAADFLSSMAVNVLPGVGRKMTKRLQDKFNVEVCGDLQKLTLARLQTEFGVKTGQLLYSSSRGEAEDEELVFEQERKSVSSEINYGIRFNNREECDKFVTQLSGEVCRRMAEISPTLKARTLTLKLMVRAECEKGKETAKFMGHGICDSHSKSHNFPGATNDVDQITKEVLVALTNFMKSNDIQAEDLRGIGVQLSKFQSKAEAVDGGILNFVKKMDSSIANQPSTSRGVNTTTNRETSKVETSKNQNSNLWKQEELSMSMVDKSVLDHLPADIREEVRMQMRNKEKESESEGGLMGRAYRDLSFSELDPEFIAALPQNVIDDLRTEMKSRSTTRSESAFDRIMASSRSSPGKLMAPSSSSSSPALNKQSRSPKNSPSFIKSSKKTLNGADQCAKKVLKNINFENEVEQATVDENVKLQTEEEEEELATLNGVRELNDLKLLYRTWIKSTDGPSSDDTKICQKFLCDVVKENELNLVYDSMKILRRLCLEANSLMWNQFYNSLVNRVQDVMVQTYGKKLFVNF